LRTRIQVLGVCWLICLSPLGDAGAEPQLIESVTNRDTEALRALVAQGADVNVLQPRGATALHWAAHCDDRPTAELMRPSGARVNVANSHGIAPLGFACENGNAPMAERLLHAGADINAGNNAGEAAFHGAAYRGNEPGVQYLADQGAAVNPTNKNGRTPLDVAEGEHFQATYQIHQSTADLLRKPGGTSSPSGTPGSPDAGEVMGM